MNRSEAQTILNHLGFRTNTPARYNQAVRDFQRGWNLGRRLLVDGIVGPNTSAALRESDSRRRAGKGTASAHFSYSEFACKCGGRYSSCRRIVVYRYLLRGLERYRRELGSSVHIVSGYRCANHNRRVGGATRSQHLYGKAADIAKRLGLERVKNLETFRGIGYSRSSGKVAHVDVRSGSGNNPTVWTYA